jgi:hypothetical protein
MKKSILLFIIIETFIEANTLIDYDTGLEWQNNYDTKTVQRDWQGAKQYCKQLTLRSKSDWRLPTIQELQSIVDVNLEPAIKKGFKYVGDYEGIQNYWSSTRLVFDDSSAWYINFGNGDTADTTTSDSRHFVRCVRGRQ